MHLTDALEKARRILIEEQSAPTLTYTYGWDAWPSNSSGASQEILKGAASLAGALNLPSQRAKRPRDVHENPKLHKFSSVNFDLLLRIFNQLIETDRPGFVLGLLKHVEQPLPPQSPRKPLNQCYPSMHGEVSALPLLAEFLIRTGHLKELLEATKKSQLPAFSLAMMLTQIEEMLALNFNLFSDSELEKMPSELAHLRTMAHQQTYIAMGERGGPMKQNPHYKQGYADKGKAIVERIDGIKEECRRARYFYLKGALQELPNLEIASDKIKVEGFLVKLGFRSDMVAALDAAEQDYRSESTTFELKNCLGHLRTFLEHLHRDAAKAVALVANETVEDRWAPATIYLRQQGFFSQRHEDFITKFYTLISDESVHALGTDREYARLLRNVIIEYGVMFLTVLDKRGVRLS